MLSLWVPRERGRSIESAAIDLKADRRDCDPISLPALLAFRDGSTMTASRLSLERRNWQSKCDHWLSDPYPKTIVICGNWRISDMVRLLPNIKLIKSGELGWMVKVRAGALGDNDGLKRTAACNEGSGEFQLNIGIWNPSYSIIRSLQAPIIWLRAERFLLTLWIQEPPRCLANGWCQQLTHLTTPLR